MLIIPHPTVQPRQDVYQIEAAIDGVPYVLTTSWSGTSWYLDVAQGEETLVAGIGLRLYWPVLLGCVSPKSPAGYFTAISQTNDQTEAAREDLGARVQLAYKAVAR